MSQTLNRSLTDFIMALANLSVDLPDCSRTVKMAFVEMTGSFSSIGKEIEKLYEKYEDSDTTEECGRIHARMFAKFKTMDEKIEKFETVFTSQIRKSIQLSEHMVYLKKRVMIVKDSFPKSPRKIEDGFANLFSSHYNESKQDAVNKEDSHDCQWNDEESFTKKLNEFRVAVSAFLNSYPDESQSTGIVGMIHGAGNDVILQPAWNCKKSDCTRI